MKVEIVLTMLVSHCVLDVVVEEPKILAAFVRDDYLHSGSKRHRNVTVEALAFGACKESRLKRGHVPECHSEKIAQRRAYSWFAGTIPEHFNLQSPQHRRASVI